LTPIGVIRAEGYSHAWHKLA